MKKIPLLFVLILICSSINISFCQQSKNDLEYDNLKGKVKSVKVIEIDGKTLDSIYEQSMGNAAADEIIIEEHNLNKIKCLPIDYASYTNYSNVYNKNGDIIQSTTHYNDYITQNIRFDDKNGKISYWQTINSSLDENNNVVKDTQIYNYTYDKIGNIIQIDTKIEEYYKLSFVYDKNNNVIEIKKLNKANKLLNLTLFSYDNKNRLTDCRFYSSEIEENAGRNLVPNKAFLVFEYTYKYNNEGKISKETYYKRSNTETMVTNYKYQNNIKTSYCGDFTITEQYDSYNNVVKEETLSEIDAPNYKNSKYEYDKKGNWIKKSTFANYSEEPDRIIERKIEYYE